MLKTKYPTTQEYLDKYRAKVYEGKGLTASEWDHYNRLEKAHDYDRYKDRKDAEHIKYCIRLAKNLTIEELKQIIKDKENGI